LDREFIRFKGALPLAKVRKVACNAFYEVEDSWKRLAGRYFFSLLDIMVAAPWIGGRSPTS